MFAHEIEWLTGIVRWLHVVVGILWIGTSFHLFSWEYKFNRRTGLKPGVEGNLWMIQGGDFYYVEKLKNAPAKLPDELQWFKYEAYFTWLSGFFLLVLVYYIDAQSMLINPAAASIAPPLAIMVSLLSLPACWIVYQYYCKTRFADNLPLSAALGVIVVALLSYFLAKMFTGRAVFIHVGVLFGTIMSANVFFVIIPWHKSLVAAIKAGKPLKELYQSHPGIRSDHNHYLAWPVIFIMLSSHLPLAYNHANAWIVVTFCILATGFFKHAYSLKQEKRYPGGIGYLAIGVLFIISAVVFTRSIGDQDDCKAPVAFDQVEKIVNTRCISCHSSTPTDAVWCSPPNDIVFDTPDEIYDMRDRILYRAVDSQTMPPVNKTHMRIEDRLQLGCWIQSGARPD